MIYIFNIYLYRNSLIMKIVLTESQIKMLTEDVEIIGRYKVEIEDLIKKVNIIFSKIQYSSIGEILDGDSDLSILSQKLEEFENVLSNKETKLDHYFNNNMSQEEYDAKWEKTHDALRNLGTKLKQKIGLVGNMLGHLEKIIGLNIQNHFKDIKVEKV